MRRFKDAVKHATVLKNARNGEYTDCVTQQSLCQSLRGAGEIGPGNVPERSEERGTGRQLMR